MADNFSQVVKQQADIVRIVGEYVKLRKSGANWSALCPFHKEKSGSFYLYPGTASYYCFGCHEHGDVFSFVMKMETLSFPEAVKSVAAKMGIPLPKREFGSPDEAREAGLRRQLMDAHEAATQYFEQSLKSPEAARAREYLTLRGVTAETIAKFRIGYAPESFNDMRDRLGKFFSDEALRASGLFSAKEQEDGSPGPMYARFRKRITFPIMNEQGKTIAFTARALDSEAQDAKAGPKYMNSPETPLYTKGQVLFNLDKAKGSIRELDIALLVEGQMDCISVFMGGIANVIATSGTAFTEHQVRLLSRFTKRVVLNFDPDQAGLNAAKTTIFSLLEAEFEIRVVTLEGGLDPDRFIKDQGMAAYSAAVRAAVPIAIFLIERARAEFGTRTPEAKVKCFNMLLPYIRRIPNQITRNEFVEDAAQKLGIESSLMRQEFKQAAAQRVESVKAAQAKYGNDVECIVLRALVLPEASSARQVAADKLGQHPEWYQDLESAALIDVLVHAPAPDDPFEAAPDNVSRALLANALDIGAGGAAAEAVTADQVESSLATLHGRYISRRQREVRVQMAEASRRGDNEMLLRLAQEKVRLDGELKK
jgi:DNA primase